MGGRRHAVLQQSDHLGQPMGDLYLYVHWHGDVLATIIRDALGRSHARWNDPAYLARIIASDVFKTAGIAELTGAGLGPDYMEDPADDDVFVHLTNETVTIGEHTWTFAQYVSLDDQTLARDYS